MNKNIKTTLVLPGMMIAAVLVSGCVEEVSDYEIETSSPTPTPEVTPPVLLKKEIHQEIDTTPALAYLLYPSISNITLEAIGFEVTLTGDVHSLSDIGKPLVSYIIKVFKISGDSEVESVSVNLSNPLELYNVFIEPAQPPISSFSPPQEYVINNETYASHEPYPGKAYNYRLGGNPIHGKRIVVHIFPIQYIPAEGRIVAHKNASVSIVYHVPAQEGCS